MLWAQSGYTLYGESHSLSLSAQAAQRRLCRRRSLRLYAAVTITYNTYYY